MVQGEKKQIEMLKMVTPAVLITIDTELFVEDSKNSCLEK